MSCLSDQQFKIQRYSIYSNIGKNGRQAKAANPHIWEAGTRKCLIFD